MSDLETSACSPLARQSHSEQGSGSDASSLGRRTLKSKTCLSGTSLEVQWLRLHASTAGGTGLIPGQGTKTPHATQHGQKIIIINI